MKEHGAYSASEAASYDSDREIEPLWHAENAYVRDLVARLGSASILDVPVGTGRFFGYYANRRLAGIDISESMLDKARERACALGMQNAILQLGSVTALPFADREFDLVLCWRLLHLLPPETLAPALAEMARTCSGVLCVQVYERAAFPQRMLAKASRWIRRAGLIASGRRRLTPWSHIHAYSYSRAEFEHAAINAGLGVPSTRDHIGSYEGTNVIALLWDIR